MNPRKVRDKEFARRKSELMNKLTTTHSPQAAHRRQRLDLHQIRQGEKCNFYFSSILLLVHSTARDLIAAAARAPARREARPIRRAARKRTRQPSKATLKTVTSARMFQCDRDKFTFIFRTDKRQSHNKKKPGEDVAGQDPSQSERIKSAKKQQLVVNGR